MPTRRRFIAGAAVTAAGVMVSATQLSGSAKAPAKAPTPAPSASPAPPSALAVALVVSLQKALPHAKLSDALVQKIAGDIDSNFSIAKAFRTVRLKNWDEPDFVSYAEPDVCS